MTTYANVIDGQIVTVGRPPNVTEVDGVWYDLRNLDPAILAAARWFPLVDTARPADTAETTTDRSVELVDGTPTVVWTTRPWTANELEAQRQAANQSIIDTAITAALAELDTLIAAPALPTVPAGSLTNAQLSEALRQLRDGAQATRAGAQRVAQVLKQTIRLVRGDFDDIT
jgi:hypothetical protein